MASQTGTNVGEKRSGNDEIRAIMAAYQMGIFAGWEVLTGG